MGRIPSIYQLSLQFDLSGTPVKFPPACVSHGCDANTQTNKHTDRHLNTSQRIQNCVCCSSHYNRWLPSFQKTVTGFEKKHFALISTALTLQTTQVCKKMTISPPSVSLLVTLSGHKKDFSDFFRCYRLNDHVTLLFNTDSFGGTATTFTR